MNTPPPGKIITFYSYKGGTGRSMLLANVAWILASNGFSVLVVDWDLEAPGIHRYFRPFLRDKELTSSEGLIDFVWDCADQALTPPNLSAHQSTGQRDPAPDILRYAVSLDHEFPQHPSRERIPGIDVIPAGRQGPMYATRVNAFKWSDFYTRLGGGEILETVREQMRSNYDYVLIDSRTGVSDTASICTVQMPDLLVVCFTLNIQSIEGASAIAESVLNQRRKVESQTQSTTSLIEKAGPSWKRDSEFRIMAVPTRVEQGEKDMLEAARDHAWRRFAPLLDQPVEQSGRAVWGNVEVQYHPYYAYEEILATIGDKPGDPKSLLASVERILSAVTQGKVTTFKGLEEPERVDLLKRYLRVSSGKPSEIKSHSEIAKAKSARGRVSL